MQPTITSPFTGALFLIDALRQLGTSHVFMVPGAHLDPFHQALVETDTIYPVICSHELGAAYMALGYARVRHAIGVVATIGGPGATNLLTAVVTARQEAIPMLVVTGDVPVSHQGWLAFHEAGPDGSDDLTCFRGITKYSARVQKIEALAEHLQVALECALSRPYGPVHLMIPHNIFQDVLPRQPQRTAYPLPLSRSLSSEQVAALRNVLCQKAKVALLVGEGVNHPHAARALQSMVEALQLPTATTFGAKGLLPENHPLSLNNFGYAGGPLASRILLRPELESLLMLGVTLNDRNTLNWDTELFSTRRDIAHIADCPQGQMLEHYPHIKSMAFDPNQVILNWSKWVAEPSPSIVAARKQWRHTWQEQPHTFPLPGDSVSSSGMEPAHVVHTLRQLLSPQTRLFVDSGHHRLFAGWYWKAERPDTFFSASLTAPMGWAITAAIGAQMAGRYQPTVVWTGDGCMLMHGLELVTAVKYEVPLVVVVSNNGGLGNVYLRQLKKSRRTAASVQIPPISWSAFAESIGAVGFHVTTCEQLQAALQKAFELLRPVIIDVITTSQPYLPESLNAAASYQ